MEINSYRQLVTFLRHFGSCTKGGGTPRKIARSNCASLLNYWYLVFSAKLIGMCSERNSLSTCWGFYFSATTRRRLGARQNPGSADCLWGANDVRSRGHVIERGKCFLTSLTFRALWVVQYRQLKLWSRRWVTTVVLSINATRLYSSGNKVSANFMFRPPLWIAKPCGVLPFRKKRDSTVKSVCFCWGSHWMYRRTPTDWFSWIESKNIFLCFREPFRGEPDRDLTKTCYNRAI